MSERRWTPPQQTNLQVGHSAPTSYSQTSTSSGMIPPRSPPSRERSGALGEVIHLEANQDFPQRLLDYRPDFVFNIAEGLFGPNRESHVPAICEFLGVPCHASDPLTLGLCLHKARTKEILERNGVPTAAFRLARSVADARATRLPFPLFVKPAFEGSGKGVTSKSLCRNRPELVAQVEYLLATYREPVLMETYLPGREFTVAILGNGDEARCLPIVGMQFDTLPAGAPPIYGYEAKWVWDTPERPLDIFECPGGHPRDAGEQVRARGARRLQRAGLP